MGGMQFATTKARCQLSTFGGICSLAGESFRIVDLTKFIGINQTTQPQ
jgi:hypothetical protein